LIPIHHQEKIYHRCFAKIDLDAILSNFQSLKAKLQPNVLALATVKADAYGHGSVAVSKCLEPYADYFGVACLEEALVLREAGITKPILVLSYTAPALYEILIRNHVTAAVYRVSEAKLLSQTAERIGQKAKVHVAVDTGMGRIGFEPGEKSADAIQEISKLRGITLEGLFSHYACADQKDKKDAQDQTKRFDEMIAQLEERGVNIPIKHICNSAASMEFEKQYDMCRLGIALYGMYPSDEVDHEKIALVPAMEVVSHVIHVKNVPQGTLIGYGHQYCAPSEKKIATVSIGYADGFNRCLSDRGFVLIRGKRAPVTGRVCMDQIMVDVTEIENVAVGDHAVILGQNGNDRISAEELGALAGSFHYEVVCNFLPRVKRVYYRDGKITSSF